MNTKKPQNSYDETKKMLNTIRNLQESTKNKKVLDEQKRLINEASTFERDNRGDPDPGGEPLFDKTPDRPSEGSDYTVINDVEVVIHSEDPEDLELTDEEKGNFSQLIDDFRAEVYETVVFDKLNIYETNAKLDGKLGSIGLQFTLSTGDDTGLYINGQMLKIDENTLLIFKKLLGYQLKFSNTINDLLVRRRAT